MYAKSCLFHVRFMFVSCSFYVVRYPAAPGGVYEEADRRWHPLVSEGAYAHVAVYCKCSVRFFYVIWSYST